MNDVMAVLVVVLIIGALLPWAHGYLRAVPRRYAAYYREVLELTAPETHDSADVEPDADASTEGADA